MTTNTFQKSLKYNLKDSIGYAGGAIVSKIVQKSEAGNVSLFAFDKGQQLSEHTAPFDALVQIVDGKANIIIDGKGHELSEGDLIIMPADVPHAVESVTAFKMLLTMLKK